jgi:hypothetical protein
MLLKKGALSRCAELATSLNIGKLVSKIRLMVARDGGSEENNETEVWSYVVDKLHFDISSLKVPKVNEGSDVSRMLARFNYMIDMVELMEDLFEKYLDLRYGSEWEGLEAEMSQWVKDLMAGRFDTEE